jgi:hypothetical protein
MTTLAVIIASLQIGATSPQTRLPCEVDEVLLAGGMDTGFGQGAWGAVICRNGTFLAWCGGSHASGTLPWESQRDLQRLLAALPRKRSEYSFGRLRFEAWHFKLLIDEGTVRRSYHVAYRQPQSACRSECQQVLEVSRYLYRLLPLPAHGTAVTPWYPRARR